MRPARSAKLLLPCIAFLTVNKCPRAGCWPPPPPPEVQVDTETYLWSETRTWLNTTDSFQNPLNKFVFDIAHSTLGNDKYKLAEKQQWAAGTPSNFGCICTHAWGAARYQACGTVRTRSSGLCTDALFALQAVLCWVFLPRMLLVANNASVHKPEELLELKAVSSERMWSHI
jgi:hypothetical protein